MLDIYLNPKKSMENLEIKGYFEMFLKYILPFSFFPVLGYLIGFTVLKSNYISSIIQFLDMLKNDPKADKSTIDYMNLILNMLQNNDFNKILIFLLIVWIFEIFKPIFLTGLTYFFGKSFGGEDNPMKVFNLVVYAVIPVYISEITYMINSPLTAIALFLSSFYMFYLIFIGSEKVLKVPSENSKNFQFVVVLVIFYVILSGILGMLQTKLIQMLIS
ncbi:hypothetical protein SYO3AOP1_0391 [Sulfurihydrogenibium sp. YO3AOP1]|uniref:YIP1 family protein n=1 Tax=Sulfurihydrogenibium sp. (strain YO3AOP1) TaxID=436114 RepID=UPI0001724AAA|nr:Yip1 family protein [Sulfurihydrogenibium sp. YO3AOP1]ACD66034.1 hypothetical protein SYO3AOP1_0391 [Sulfurihydrogenibium sp. YO3AOP1]